MTDKKKLFISTPCYDAMMTMQYTISILNLVTALNEKKIEFMIDFLGNESLITRARNKSVAKFLQTDCTHLLFIDSDIEFRPNAVFDLLDYDKDVTCCVYPKKGFNWNRFMHSMKTEPMSSEEFGSRGLDFAYNVLDDGNGNIIKRGNFVKVRHAATGFMLIKRSIIETLCKKHKELEIITDDLSQKDTINYGLFCCMIKDKVYLSEDYSFCDRVNEASGEVWINIKHNLNHIGKYSFNSDIQHRENYGRSISEKQFYK